jgi:redox-sensitive bicupin YhaK (pirin superfamily)
MSKQILHLSASRGHANHGWLDSKHSFSFANYYNPERMHFGVLRVLNDDTVAAGMGFGKHPHDNMEIISIPLAGDLEHADSMGNTTVIKNGDIQVMSAGTGITHSEYNKNKDQEVKFLQIWIFPNKHNVAPRYDQITLNLADRHNHLQQIISPNENEEGVWIHQNAWFHLAKFDQYFTSEYTLKDPSNGLYIFNLSGQVQINEQILHPRDGYGIWETNKINIKSITESEFLIMEVPMKIS